MKLAYLNYYSLLYIFQIQDLFSQVEAISNEISYPLGSMLGKGSKHTIHHISPFRELLDQPDQSEFQSETSNRAHKIKRKKKFKKKNNKRKNENVANKQNNRKKVNNRRTQKSKNRRWKNKFVKTSMKRDDRSSEFGSLETIEPVFRKPVDIVVHIKMQD